MQKIQGNEVMRLIEKKGTIYQKNSTNQTCRSALSIRKSAKPAISPVQPVFHMHTC